MQNFQILFLAAVDLEAQNDLTKLFLPAFIVLIVLVLAFLIHGFYKIYIISKKQSAEWQKLEDIIAEKKLSPEEASILRTKLRTLGYTNPVKVLKSPEEFQFFFKKALKRRTHHHELLLEMVRTKVFSNDSKSSVSNSISNVSSSNHG